MWERKKVYVVYEKCLKYKDMKDWKWKKWKKDIPRK